MRQATRFGIISAAAGVFLFAYCFVELSCVPAGETKNAREVLPSRVLIIRHAEKPPEAAKSVHLSDEGQLRAEALPELFTASKTRKEPFTTPDFIFAAKDSKESHRSSETVTPLSKKLKLPINTNFRNEDYEAMVREIFSNRKYAGKTILICWHQGTARNWRRGRRPVPENWKATVSIACGNHL